MTAPPRVAFVTGAASGMGAACVERLASRGPVVAADITAPEGRFGPGVTAVALDVTDADQVLDAVEAVVAAHGRLDVAVNAAGVSQRMHPVAELALAEWRRVIAVNLDGVFHCLRAQIPAMVRSGGGAIVNVGSTMSVAASSSGISAYAASKHAVLGLTRAAALEVADRGVRVNAIGPGITDTPMTAGWSDAKKAEQVARHPVGRFGRVEEIAALVDHLVGEESGFVTGAFFPVDGGFGAQ